MKDLDLVKLKEAYDKVKDHGALSYIGMSIDGFDDEFEWGIEEFEDLVKFFEKFGERFDTFKEFIEYLIEEINEDDFDLCDELGYLFINKNYVYQN